MFVSGRLAETMTTSQVESGSRKQVRLVGLHALPAPQFTHALPPFPQPEAAVPGRQPVVSQQPVRHVAAQEVSTHCCWSEQR